MNNVKQKSKLKFIKYKKQRWPKILKLQRGRLVEADFDRSILKYITLHKIKVSAH